MKKLLPDLVRVLSIQLVVVLLIIGLFALGYIFRKDILISYHRWGMQSSLKAMSRPAQSNPDKRSRYGDKFQRHEKALINLGYLEERDFNTKYLKINSPQIETMLAELRKIHPRSSYSVGGGQGITITCRSEMMPTFVSLVDKYDVRPDEPNQPAAPAKIPE